MSDEHDAITITVTRRDLSCVLRDAEKQANPGGFPHAPAARIREACSEAMRVKREPWNDAGDEVAYRWYVFTHARDPLGQAMALADLSNAMHDLRTFLPGYDYETGTLPFERDDD